MKLDPINNYNDREEKRVVSTEEELVSEVSTRLKRHIVNLLTTKLGSAPTDEEVDNVSLSTQDNKTHIYYGPVLIGAFAVHLTADGNLQTEEITYGEKKEGD